MILSPFKRLFDSFIYVLAPRTCMVCDEVIHGIKSNYEFICKRCELFLPPAHSSEFILNRFIENFHQDKIYLSNFYSCFSIKEDKNYIKIVYGLKYYGFQRIGNEFGQHLGRIIKEESNNDFAGIVPVPIHHARLRERGFNQSEVIAKAISKELNTPVIKAIKRKRYTTTQTQLSKNERKINIIDAIVPAKQNQRIMGNYLLVDDVLTTGSTANECAGVLLEMGASRVDAAIIAVA